MSSVNENTISNWLLTSAKKLQRVHISSASLDSELIVAYAFGKERSWVLANGDKVLTQEQVQDLEDFLSARLSHTPLAYIFNKREFYGLEFYVDEHVLIPRPESEAIVEHALKHAPRSIKLLDVGTGSGALAIAIKKNRPDLDVFASDISPDALAVAKKNARTHQVAIEFAESDLLRSISTTPEWIVANLPYVPSELDLNEPAKHEPKLALLAGKDGLEYYHKLFEQLESKKFSSVSTVVAESNPNQFAQLDTDWQQQAITSYITVITR